MQGLTYYDVLLVPRKSIVDSRSQISLKTRFSRNVEIDVPIVSANMDTITEGAMAIAMARAGGLGVIHRFCTIEKQVAETKMVKDLGLKVAVAVGIQEGEFDRIRALLQVKPDAFVLDVAHAHSERVMRTIGKIFAEFPDIELVVGNIATYEAAKELLDAFPKIAALKVGIGAGSVCTTREKTGCGVPLVTSIIDCCREKRVPIIADGGVRSSGDIVKALAFGADTTMFGGLFAGCLETPSFGDTKIYRGMASRAVIVDNNKSNGHIFEEGITQVVKTKEISASVIVQEQLVPGILSGLSYLGVRDIKGLHDNPPQYNIISAHGIYESYTYKWG